MLPPYYIVNETEAGLAVIANENGVLSLPRTNTELDPSYLMPNIGNRKTTVEIAEVGTLVFTNQLPPNTPHHRIDYNKHFNSNNYVATTSLLLRFAGNFFTLINLEKI